MWPNGKDSAGEIIYTLSATVIIVIISVRPILPRVADRQTSQVNVKTNKNAKNTKIEFYIFGP